MEVNVKPLHKEDTALISEMEILPCEHAQTSTGSKLNKDYLRKLDRKFDRLFKGTGHRSNISKSVYSFESLEEEESEYNSDSDFEEQHQTMVNEAEELDELSQGD